LAKGGLSSSIGRLIGLAVLCAATVAPAGAAAEIPDPAGATVEPPLIGAVFSLHTTSSARGTKLVEIATRSIPAGMTAVVRCTDRSGNPSSPRTCPFRKLNRSFGSAKAEHDFAPRFENRRFRPGTRISVEIAAAGTTGKLLGIQVRKGGFPTVTLACVPPGQPAGPC
jgi:hypothetical protein